MHKNNRINDIELDSDTRKSQASNERFIYSFMVSKKNINFNGLSAASNQSLIDDNVIIIRERLPFHSCTDIYSQNQKLIHVLIHSRTSLASNYLSFSNKSQRELAMYSTQCGDSINFSYNKKPGLKKMETKQRRVKL